MSKKINFEPLPAMRPQTLASPTTGSSPFLATEAGARAMQEQAKPSRNQSVLAPLKLALAENDAARAKAECERLWPLTPDEAIDCAEAAIFANSAGALREFAQSGAPLFDRPSDPRIRPVLLTAVQEEATDCVAALIECGAEPERSIIGDPKTVWGRAPLFEAIALGNVECVRLLLPKSDLAREGGFGRTALMIAAHEGDWESFEALMAVDDPARKTPSGETAVGSIVKEKPNLHDDELNARKLDALLQRMGREAWEKRAPKIGWAATAAKEGMESSLAWMAKNKVGFGANANEAIWRLFQRSSEPNDATLFAKLFPLADFSDPAVALLPKMKRWLVSDLCLDNPDANMGNPPGQRLGAGAVFSWRWRVADEMAARNPLQPGAKDIWELADGNPKGLPRLAAAVEAEILRQTIGSGLSAESAARPMATMDGQTARVEESSPAPGSARRL